jgi:hypothetical protein
VFWFLIFNISFFMVDLVEIARRRSVVEQKLRDAEGRLSQLDGRISELCISLGFDSCPSVESLESELSRLDSDRVRLEGELSSRLSEIESWEREFASLSSSDASETVVVGVPSVGSPSVPSGGVGGASGSFASAGSADF